VASWLSWFAQPLRRPGRRDIRPARFTPPARTGLGGGFLLGAWLALRLNLGTR
jgi:hypothetical protein